MKVNGYEIKPFANLEDVNLMGADLKGADLEGADLRYANLRYADLMGVNLKGANLESADLMGVNLKGANLESADLMGVNLMGVNLRYANLKDADLEGADLEGADLTNTKLPLFQTVPQQGDFIGYKKLRSGKICKLLITGDRTSSLISKKCRCSRAKVLDIYNKAEVKYRSGYSSYDHTFKYEVGKEVFVSNYNSDVRVDCTEGIHFFITEQEAIDC